jgi:eukaryotic-like serine/threonine-protein kinase
MAMELDGQLQQRLQSALGDTHRILRELGGGGMSRVFLAEEVRLGRQVVVKVLPPETGAAVNVERFEREIKLAARLQHPHIVPLLSAAAAGDLLYYIMPFIQGESLRSKLAREGELPVAEAGRILREIVDALSYAHRNGVVHRDIKPYNVLLSDGHAVVTDFGVAKAVSVSSGSSSLTSLGVALGTPAYMAPEQAAADPHVDHRADIYAAGVLGYEMLAGRTPFNAPTPQGMLAAHITQAPEPVARVRPAVSPALNAVLMRCLEKRAADRWQSAAELLGQLEAATTPSGGLSPTAATPAISSGTEQAIRRFHPARVALLFAAASAGALGVVYFLIRRLGLPDWVLTGTIVLLLIGLPITLVAGHLERRRALARASGRVSAAPAGGLHGWLTWRMAMRGGVLAFAALGIVTVAYTTMRVLGIGPVGTLVASGRLSARDRLVVADFENRTADSSLGASVTEAFRIDLAQTPLVRILSSGEVGDALGRMRRDPATPVTPALAREIATREGAKGVVTGEISSLGKSYVLSARILSAADGSELVALRETAGDDAGIVAALDRLSAKVRERIGESLTSIRAGEPLEQVTTGSLEALRLYSEGSRLSDQGFERQAVERLEQAIALDSGFAMAWRKLAVALDNARNSQERVIAATTKAWQHRERLTEIERQLAIAYYHARADVDPAKEEAAYRRVLAIQPDNYVAANNLSILLAEQGQPEAAESLVAPAIRVSPQADNMWLQLLFARMMQGRDAETRATLDTMGARVGSDHPMFAWARGMALTSMGDYEGAERGFLELASKVGDTDLGELSAAHQGLAVVARIRGRLDKAERHTRVDMEVSGRRGLPGVVLLDAVSLARDALVFRRDSAGALRILDAALREQPLDSMPPLDRPGAHVATMYALAGRPEQARRILSGYESQVPEGVRRGRWEWYKARGWLALADGRPRDALAAFVQGRSAPTCPRCGGWDEGVAYERVGLPDSALAGYQRAVARDGPWKAGADQWTLGPSLKRLGELYEGRGDRARALEYYGRFVKLWKDADPVLQPTVREVRGRMAVLAGERK